jgi:calcineurin-like phosphoesterase family protein
MAKDLWVISDTHFNHANILTFVDKIGKPVRPFQSIEGMNETMIENWNRVVKPGDKVYHLGDVFFGPKEDFKKLWPKLNGKKRLIVGNHDDVNFLSSGAFFEKVMLWRKFEHLLFTHVPVHESTLMEHRFSGKQMINVHGHIHQNKSPDGNYKCVCVEQVNYTPVHIEDLLKWVSEKK